jgi:allophanate hydrolase
MTRPLTLAALRAAYADGLTPTGLIAELRREDTTPVWITKVDEATLLQRARALEAARAHGADLPLFGIPFAVKDNIDVAGLPTTAACPAFAHVPARSATVVERLLLAGALLIGKTNLDQFATGLVGTRSPYGACSSVFSHAHVSGGSSSGSAVAVASGQVSFALGTDTAGSGRVPAAFNNIVGLKPTRGLIPTSGVLPACQSLDCVSIFAGSVSDAWSVFASLQGPDDADPYSRPMQTGRTIPPARFRFGVPAGQAPLEGSACHADVIARLEQLGGTAVSFDFAPFERAARLLYQGPFVAERLAALRARGFTRWDDMDATVAHIICGAAAIDAADAFAGLTALAEAARAAAPVWNDFDVMLLPTASFHPTQAEVAADPIGVNTRLGQYTNFVNLLDLCAIAVPAGLRPDGLPYGVSLIAPAFADAAVAHLAARLHQSWAGARIGATPHAVPAELPPPPPEDHVLLAVVGAHLHGEPLHHQLTSRGACLHAITRTAPGYRLLALAGTQPAKPGLVRDPSGAGLIEIEIYRLTQAGFGSFVAEVPPPLAIGTLALEDGTAVKGFVCEPAALLDAQDITRFGGWRAWRARAHRA